MSKIFHGGTVYTTATRQEAYDGEYVIQGKHTGTNMMQFAAAKRN